MSCVLLRKVTFGWFLQLLMLLISARSLLSPPASYIVEIIVPHTLDGPKHGTARNLLSRDLVDNPGGCWVNQGDLIIL